MEMQFLENLAGIFENAEITDLGFALQKDIPSWPTHPHYMLLPWEEKRLGAVSNHFIISMGEHNGTHIDASYHFFGKEDGGKTIDEYTLDKFRGSCAVLNFAGCDENYLVSKQDILDWEQKNGEISEGNIVLLNFGWAPRFTSLPKGAAYVSTWPGSGGDAAEYLASKKIKMVGVDTFAADIWSSTDYAAHHALLSKDILIVEGLNNLDQLPAWVYFIALPLALVGGSGSPMRPIAVWKKDKN